MRAVFIILCYLLIAQTAEAQTPSAQIYECKRADGTISYQEKQCRKPEAVQREFTYADPALHSKKLHKMQKQLERQKLLVEKQEMRKLREARSAEKKRAQENKRRLRLRAKCGRVKQKIAMLEQRYKHGYTLKQGLSLDRKLAECMAQKQEYCVNE